MNKPTSHASTIFCSMFVLMGVTTCALAKMPSAAPQLPSPTGKIVTVGTEGELKRAVKNLRSDTTIVISPGQYKLTSTLYLAGPSERIWIRGATHNPDDVVLSGLGMWNKQYKNVPHGILVGNVSDVLIGNLTIRDVYKHAIALQGGARGCRRPYIYNCRLLDAGEQFIKANPGEDGIGIDGGKVQYCSIQYTETCRGWYTNGLDVHRGRGWAVRHCHFRNIRAAPGAVKPAGPAILMWNGSRDTICEGNLFVDCERGIAFGLNHQRADDHQGGIIRNNIFTRGAAVKGDYAIGLWNSAGTRVLHNTILLNGTSRSAIEVRFPSSTGCTVAYNLCDADVAQRDGARADLIGNISAARGAWFTYSRAGGIRLTSAAEAAIDLARPRIDVPSDFYGRHRPIGKASDIGANEYSAKPAEENSN